MAILKMTQFMRGPARPQSPKQTDWVESIAEQSTMIVSKKHGFSEGVE
jgi:hypothetical protein